MYSTYLVERFFISELTIMGSVCSSGMAEEKKKKKNAEVVNGEKTIRCAWKLRNKNKIVANRNNVYSPYSNSRTINGVTKQKNKETRFSTEFKKLNNPTASRAKQGSQRGSLLGRAGERAVEVLDTLGSSIPKLSTSDGFISGMNLNRGHKICILAFEVANTINKGAILFHSLSEENIQFLKKEIFQSEGVQKLVSTDTTELLSLVEADKREEFNAFSKEVVRFGNMCKEHQWHNLDRFFSRLGVDVLSNKDLKLEAEKTMQELITLGHNTAELYHELSAYDRFKQDYQEKVKEMESLNLPLKGESLTIIQSELKHQRKIVKNLQRKSLWSRNLEEVVEKLVDIITYMHRSISKFLGNDAGATVVKFTSNGSQRLGEAGLALHYANIINQINMIASRPSALPPNMRDTLYHGLPNSIKSILQSRLQNMDITKELSMTQVKAEMDKTLQWLTPIATNTTKAHQGFGWVGEWANGGNNNEFGDSTGKESNLIRLQTLYYAERNKIDTYIIELLTCLNHLVTFVRYRHHSGSNNGIKAKQGKSNSPQKGLDFQSKMLQFITTLERDRNNISQEDKSLLEEVIARTRIPGVSKSENLALTNKKEYANSGFLHYSKSVRSSPLNKGLIGFHHQNSHVLDLIDGLRH
ncbi:protein PSK SIMULATOR 2 isoform X1 [Arachis hypogaea]